MNTTITEKNKMENIFNHLQGYWDMLWNVKLPLLFGGGTSTLFGFAFEFDSLLKFFSIVLPIIVPMIITAIWTWRMNKSKKEIQIKAFQREQKRKEELHTFEQIKEARNAGLISEEATNEEIKKIIKLFESEEEEDEVIDKM